MSRTDRFLELAARYAEGTADGDEVNALEDALRADPVARQRFLRYMNVDAALGSVATGAEDCTVPRARRRWPTWRKMAGVIAAAAALLAVCLWQWRAAHHPGDAGLPPDPTATATASPGVFLTAATNARWADPDVELSLRGGETPAGLLRLEGGVAEFRFPDGATAVLLGPASFRFPGPKELFLQDGEALCRCPTPASRITLTTPATRVEDLGTEFAVHAATEAGTRVAVVSGEVRVGTADAKLLRKGEAAQVGPDRVVRLTPLRPDEFADLLRAGADNAPPADPGLNLLADPSFASGLVSGPWRGTEGHVVLAPDDVGGSAGRIAVRALGHKFWPGVRQKVSTGDVSGRLVVASVEATTPPDDRLQEKQAAILKLAFLDAQGREFANASRRFLETGSPASKAVGARVAAVAPPGTRQIEFQLLLNARGGPRGTVHFISPSLVIPAPPPPARAAAPVEAARRGDAARPSSRPGPTTARAELPAQQLPLPVTPGQLRVSNDFTATSDIAGWRLGKGKWTVEEGALKGTELPADKHAAGLACPLLYHDAAVQFRVQFSGGRESVLLFRGKAGNIGRVILSPGSVTLQKDKPNSPKYTQEKTEVLAHAKCRLAADQWHTVTAVVCGPQFAVRVDDEPAVAGTHPALDVDKTEVEFMAGGDSILFDGMRVWDVRR